ncbi:formylmethanofuran dehydrogenase subunit C [Labrys wisconsinensis]|uniref:Formylmethanofuran dehydrogenase subunit C n=1 Tax=Labrys wisconsinensis TaxID=425677 RepID=A0ABU0J1I8_9HYPH|nr:formylmethanofuran dehydrogenase subunit C [Labrys wisconsinensis]MDQ0467102.1 formylmethanofuran dehydrogenase subunit C [Labrys wisconsinensis]
MSALAFSLREAPPERLDLSPLTPGRLTGLTLPEIERLPVGTTRLGVRVGDVFTVTAGNAGDIRLLGGSARLDNVGRGLAAGRITVEGDVGQRLGFAMAGGEIVVTGAAGPFAASGARGGTVRIGGDADERAGGAVHGAMAGLDGATLIIGGRAGPRLGDRMRRGLILVRGAAGDHAGARMIAGTILAPAVGRHPGIGMRRGTILTSRHGGLLPTFVETGRHDLVFLRLLRRTLDALAPDFADLVPATVRRFAGDLATLGKGEILLPADA